MRYIYPLINHMINRENSWLLKHALTSEFSIKYIKELLKTNFCFTLQKLVRYDTSVGYRG